MVAKARTPLPPFGPFSWTPLPRGGERGEGRRGFAKWHVKGSVILGEKMRELGKKDEYFGLGWTLHGKTMVITVKCTKYCKKTLYEGKRISPPIMEPHNIEFCITFHPTRLS